MFLLANTREHLLPHLPKQAEIAEIGVNLGEFSRLILDQCAPSTLHLIDPWELSTADDDYAQAEGKAPETDQAEARYETVLAMFAKEREQDQVRIHRAYSDKAADDFADESLDWIYIDGNHTYEYVRQDLETYLPKLKPDGLILGHDYARNSLARKYGFGVVEAVNEFCQTHPVEFLFLTFEPFPTFVLAKDINAPATQKVMANVLYHLTPAVQIRNFEKMDYDQLEIDFGGSRYRSLISVG